MADEKKNIFVSHYHADADKIEGLKDLIGRHGVDMRDSSIYEAKLKNNATNENYIKYELIKPQIQWAGTVVVLIGDKTANSDYVDWEIKTAAEMDKNIVGVFLPGAKEEDVPPALNEYGSNLVGWNGEKIVDAINGEELEWEKADGTPRPNNPDGIDHYEC
ncbi:MAG: TIR domain-containing protein [Lachnospiraceae bacterium]|nr:TIR domain-containing protein [Lachnospiraceae bacterium]MBR1598639.1 TIR domain-containing protein [Lachnospiraceae bacterium]